MARATDYLTWNVPIVDPKTGWPTPEFIRLFQSRRDDVNDAAATADDANTAAGEANSNADGRVPSSRQILTPAAGGIQGGGDLSADRTLSLRAGFGVPAGGTTGQVLTKNSGTDRDTKWATPAAGGGGKMLYDLAKGVPKLADIATIGTAGMYSFTERLNIALNSKYNGGAGGTAHLGGFVVPGKSSAASLEVAVMVLPNMDRRNYHGDCLGVYNSSTGRFLVLANCGAAGYFGYSLQNWYAHDNRADIAEPSRSVPSFGPHWLHMRFDATAGLFWFGASTDGANPVWYWTAAQNIGLGFITSFDRIFFGSFDQGAEDAPYTSNTFLCYDDDSAGRQMGTA